MEQVAPAFDLGAILAYIFAALAAYFGARKGSGS